MWVGPSNLILTFKCQIDLQIHIWRSNVSWTFKFNFDVQMWIRPSNLLLTFKCELDLQICFWRSNVSWTFKFAFDVQMWVRPSIIWKWTPKSTIKWLFWHTNFTSTYTTGKGTFGTVHSSYCNPWHMHVQQRLLYLVCVSVCLHLFLCYRRKTGLWVIPTALPQQALEN